MKETFLPMTSQNNTPILMSLSIDPHKVILHYINDDPEDNNEGEVYYQPASDLVEAGTLCSDYGYDFPIEHISLDMSIDELINLVEENTGIRLTKPTPDAAL